MMTFTVPAGTLRSMDLAVLPLAVTMMAGPQIISALILVTATRAVAVSVAFVAGVALAATVGVVIMTGLARLLPVGPQAGATDGTWATIIQYGLIALLVWIAVRNWVRRDSAGTPGWLDRLMSAGPGRAFRTGLLLIGLFPSDLVVMLTVGVHLAASGAALTAALPFIGATTLIAALPLLGYLILGRRAKTVMPAVRDWMTGNAWLVNIGACLLFIALIVF
jgi:Sap, sulfolipid-1-addressing protein